VLDYVLAGDVGPGDVITLPDAKEDLVVVAVRLGHGGFLLTVTPLDGGSRGEHVVTLTAATQILKTGRQPIAL
jgi:hypothetical protein